MFQRGRSTTNQKFFFFFYGVLTSNELGMMNDDWLMIVGGYSIHSGRHRYIISNEHRELGIPMGFNRATNPWVS
jgi:hypothetical protein